MNNNNNNNNNNLIYLVNSFFIKSNIHLIKLKE